MSRRGGAVFNEKKRGIPIGNLTSQIFANIYLNEFDRFVRHKLKPLAYVRYGDDAILFVENRRTARNMRTIATDFLEKHLGLSINSKNDVVFTSNQPVHFLGHVITDRYIMVDKYTTRAVLEKTNTTNLASYKSLKLAKWPKRQLDYLVLDEITEITTDLH